MSKMYSLVRQTHTQGEAEEVTVPGWPWQQAGMFSRALPADAVALW